MEYERSKGFIAKIINSKLYNHTKKPLQNMKLTMIAWIYLYIHYISSSNSERPTEIKDSMNRDSNERSFNIENPENVPNLHNSTSTIWNRVCKFYTDLCPGLLDLSFKEASSDLSLKKAPLDSYPKEPIDECILSLIKNICQIFKEEEPIYSMVSRPQTFPKKVEFALRIIREAGMETVKKFYNEHHLDSDSCNNCLPLAQVVFVISESLCAIKQCVTDHYSADGIHHRDSSTSNSWEIMWNLNQIRIFEQVSRDEVKNVYCSESSLGELAKSLENIRNARESIKSCFYIESFIESQAVEIIDRFADICDHFERVADILSHEQDPRLKVAPYRRDMIMPHIDDIYRELMTIRFVEVGDDGWVRFTNTFFGAIGIYGEEIRLSVEGIWHHIENSTEEDELCHYEDVMMRLNQISELVDYIGSATNRMRDHYRSISPALKNQRRYIL
jgi:hypothetical protein